MFGKLVDGVLQTAPREFVENGKKIIGFTDDFLIERGYKPVRFAPYPAEDVPQAIDVTEEYIPQYTDTGEEIVQIWVAKE